MNIAIIPARGGSKRIPRKNIKHFCGKPIIGWSILAAFECGCFDRIIVSTDDPEIAYVARDFNAEVPFVRPDELSDDFSDTRSVMRHAIGYLIKSGLKLHYVACIYATAPLITAVNIKNGLDVLKKSNKKFAFSATNYAFPIQRSFKLGPANEPKMFFPDHINSRSQDLEEAWHDAGQFYWGTAKSWLSSEPIFGPLSAPIKVPRLQVQDIDTIEDWKIAELLFKIDRS